MHFNCIDRFKSPEGQEGNQWVILMQNQLGLSLPNVLMQLLKAASPFGEDVMGWYPNELHFC